MKHHNSTQMRCYQHPAVVFLILLLVLPSAAIAQEAAIKTRIFHSVAPGINQTHALGFTTPMVDLLSRKVGYSIDFEFEDKQTLMEFGKEVSDGNVSLGVIWGLEFGWLSQKYPKLKMLAVSSQGGKGEFPIQIIVPQKNNIRKFADLKGLRLATYKNASPMIRLFRDKSIRDHGFDPKTFFKAVKTYPNPKECNLLR